MAGHLRPATPGHNPACVLVLRGDLLDCLPGFLHPTRLTQQSNKVVQGAPVTVFGTVAQCRLHAPFSKRPVESSTCVDVRESALREFRNPFRTGKQIHVPQMVVVHVRIVGIALGVGTHQHDRRVPVPESLRRPSLLEPVHKTEYRLSPREVTP